MKRKVKNIFSVLLMCSMLITMLPTMAFAESNADVVISETMPEDNTGKTIPINSDVAASSEPIEQDNTAVSESSEDKTMEKTADELAETEDKLTVTFCVVNGTWSDNTSDDIVETIQAKDGKGSLKESQIPKNMRPKDGFSKGKWNTIPNPAVESITQDTTFTYTFEPIRTQEEIFLAGTNGNDSENGSAEKPVKSFERAKELLIETGADTIRIKETVEVADSQNWELPDNVMLKRAQGFNGFMIKVKSSGALSLHHIVIDGGALEGMQQSGSMIMVESGGSLAVQTGTVLQNNDMTLRTGNVFEFQGGGVQVKGTMNMTGGRIENCIAVMGGGVALSDKGKGYFSGGIITNCKAVRASQSHHEEVYHVAGGGLFLSRNSCAELSDNIEISNNSSAYVGGGISLGTIGNSWFVEPTGPSLKMTGGTISNNQSKNCGGGMFVQCNCTAEVTGGSFISNHCGERGAFGGGAVYVNGGLSGFKDGLLRLYRVSLHNNKAAIEGGAMALCPTSKTTLSEVNGAVIYENDAPSAQDIYLSDNFGMAGYWGHPTATINPNMLGGAPFYWKNDDGSDVQHRNLVNATRLSIHTDRKADDPDVQMGEGLAEVKIYNNSSDTRGGGLGSNGRIIIGGYYEVNKPEPEEIEIKVSKDWEDAGFETERPDSVKVWLRRDGVKQSCMVLKVNSGGQWNEVKFEKLPISDQNGHKYVYTIEEDVPIGYTSSVAGTVENGFVITNTKLSGISVNVKKEWKLDDGGTKPSSVTAALLKDGAEQEAVELNEQNGWAHTWNDLNKDSVWTVEEKNVPAGFTSSISQNGLTFTITNDDVPAPPAPPTPPTPPTPTPEKTSVSVKKEWKLDDGRTKPSSVTVALLKDGVEQEAVELNEQNGWAHTWSDLNKDSVWMVEEKNVPAGFTSSISQNGLMFTITNDDVPAPPAPPTPPDDPPAPPSVPPTPPDRPTIPSDPVPKTDDISHGQLFYLLSFISLGAGIFFLMIYKNKNKKDSAQ